jgi:hypothetical protein
MVFSISSEDYTVPRRILGSSTPSRERKLCPVKSQLNQGQRRSPRGPIASVSFQNIGTK